MKPQSAGSAFPPALTTSVRGTKTFRILVGLSTSSTITYTWTTVNLLQLMCIATASATFKSLFTAVRLRRVVYRSATDNTNPIFTLPDYLSWPYGAGDTAAPAITRSVVAYGTSRPSVVSLKPGPRSLSGFWNDGTASSATDVFTLVVQPRVGSSAGWIGVLDITVDFVLADLLHLVTSNTSMIGGLTVGTIGMGISQVSGWTANLLGPVGYFAF
jgi:hypothetical protein